MLFAAVRSPLGCLDLPKHPPSTLWKHPWKEVFSLSNLIWCLDAWKMIKAGGNEFRKLALQGDRGAAHPSIQAPVSLNLR